MSLELKRQVLFVDDEPNILHGLKRMLRSNRNEWDMYFANIGPEALELMEKQDIDALVSNMRMPGMDGADLLDKVQKLYPKVFRSVLFGHSEKELVMRSVDLSHRYISKPCDADFLKGELTSAFALNALLES
jgi:YesN/AraC family two-component response regulator